MIRLDVREAKTLLARHLRRVERGETILLSVGTAFFKPLAEDFVAGFEGTRST